MVMSLGNSSQVSIERPASGVSCSVCGVKSFFVDCPSVYSFLKYVHVCGNVSHHHHTIMHGLW